MTIFSTGAIDATLGAVFGAVCTAVGAFFLANKQFRHLREVSKLDAWHVAAKDFVSAFSEELAVLDGEEELSIRLDEYLLRAYDAKHKSAIAAFEHFVPDERRASFKATCKEYHSSSKTQEMLETG